MLKFETLARPKLWSWGKGLNILYVDSIRGQLHSNLTDGCIVSLEKKIVSSFPVYIYAEVKTSPVDSVMLLRVAV